MSRKPSAVLFDEQELSMVFDSAWYRAQYGLAADVDAASHYDEAGWKLGYDPTPLFRTSWYLETNADVTASKANPLRHFLEMGAAEGRSPNPLFDPAHYSSSLPASFEGRDYWRHYMANWRSAASPHILFDQEWYLRHHPDVAATGVNPLYHYLRWGSLEGRDPHPLFSQSWYLERRPLTANSRLTLLEDYIVNDKNSHRDTSEWFSVDLFLRNGGEEASKYDTLLEEYLRSSGDIGVNRSFDARWYRAKFADSAASKQAPLLHFMREGRHLGRPAAPSESYGRYDEWLQRQDRNDAKIELERRLGRNLPIQPKFSIIVPVYKIAPKLMDALIDSVQEQSYENWELCFALAYFGDPKLTKLLKRAAARDERIKLKVLAENGGISRNSNAALTLATGDYVALLDHDDVLPPQALYEMARAISENPDADLIYSDKDMISEDGSEHLNPLFKPAWSPEVMLNANYLTHFNVMRRARIEEIGGWDPETDGAQDWDLFLRVIGGSDRVAHVPSVLYNWRIVSSSVASGGIDAKPFAAEGQLNTLRKHLSAHGWPGAEPYFMEKSHIRIRWSPDWTPSVGLVFTSPIEERRLTSIVRNSGYSNVSTVVAAPREGADAINAKVAALACDVIVFVSGDFSPQDSSWLNEIVGPLQNDKIGVTGGQVVDSDGKNFETGWIVDRSTAKPLFRGLKAGHYSLTGSAKWYRNFSAVAGAFMALRKTTWDDVGGLKADTSRPDLELCQRVRDQLAMRVMYNPFALVTAKKLNPFEVTGGVPTKRDRLRISAPQTDPYLNPHLFVRRNNDVAIRSLPPKSQPQAPYNYSAEAGYAAMTYDFDRSTIQQSIQGCIKRSKRPSPKRVAWVVPAFDMPFYGGTMTILRAAEHMRVHHGVSPVFVGLGPTNPVALRNAIAQAFPELAVNCEIFALKDPNEPIRLGPLWGAIATLWTTAFVVLKLEKVRHKFYFVQDYEPLFYPAGTVSSLVEGTYQFGFTGICNTEPLKRSYEYWGGKAEAFLPAVDRTVFNATGRAAPRPDDPVAVLSYARPGHSRNCFEVLSRAMADVKATLGGRVQFYTAGSDWDPEHYGLGGVVEHLGLLPYAETGVLYRGIDIGVAAMATRHPSYLPFELMASGVVVCTNRNPDTTWLLKDGENSLLFDLSRSSIAETLTRAIEDAELRRKLQTNGAKVIDKHHSDWATTCETIYQFIAKHAGE